MYHHFLSTKKTTLKSSDCLFYLSYVQPDSTKPHLTASFVLVSGVRLYHWQMEVANLCLIIIIRIIAARPGEAGPSGLFSLLNQALNVCLFVCLSVCLFVFPHKWNFDEITSKQKTPSKGFEPTTSCIEKISLYDYSVIARISFSVNLYQVRWQTITWSEQMKLRTGKSLGGVGKAPSGTILRATSAKSDLVKIS